MRPDHMQNGLCWSTTWLVVQTIVDWTDVQRTGDIGAPDNHRWCNWLLHAARRVLWDTALQQPMGSPSDPS
jgi:hypothetical protein